MIIFRGNFFRGTVFKGRFTEAFLARDRERDHSTNFEADTDQRQDQLKDTDGQISALIFASVSDLGVLRLVGMVVMSTMQEKCFYFNLILFFPYFTLFFSMKN